MGSAIKWLEKNTVEEHDKVLICTDSQSLTAALNNESPDVASLCCRLDAMDRHIDIQWVPGYMDIPKNELADKFANEATELGDDAQPTSLKAAKAVIKRTLKDKPSSHARTAAVYANHSTAKDGKTLTNRRDAVMLARLRAGHSMQLAAYRHLMDPTTDPRCPNASEITKPWNTGYSNVQRLSAPDNPFLATPTPSFQSLPTIRSRRSSWRSAASKHASAPTQKKKQQQSNYLEIVLI